MILCLGLISILFFHTSGGHEVTAPLKYSEFTQAVRDGKIESVQVQGDKISGTFTKEGVIADEKSGTVHEKFETIGTLNADIQDLLEEKSVTYEFLEQEEDS